jgi:hypothetical protein
MNGIYCYQDTLKDNQIVYVGKDSFIDKNRRHQEHRWKSRYHKQVINRVLQNNPDRYNYQIILKGNLSEKLLNAFEKVFIHKHNPKFNFTDGGDGSKGYRFSEAQKKKLSNIHKGQIPWNKGMPNCFNHTDETKQRIRESQTGKGNSMYGKPAWNKGITGKDNHNFKDYYRIVKDGKSGKKQRYSILKDKKKLKRSVDVDYLLQWFKENYPNEEIRGADNLK